jgi:hypothetical protein
MNSLLILDYIGERLTGPQIEERHPIYTGAHESVDEHSGHTARRRTRRREMRIGTRRRMGRAARTRRIRRRPEALVQRRGNDFRPLSQGNSDLR